VRRGSPIGPSNKGGNPLLTDILVRVKAMVGMKGISEYCDQRLGTISKGRYDHLNDYEFWKEFRRVVEARRSSHLTQEID
jgi:hypothetical protein